MRKSFLPFSKPSIDEGDIAAVGDVLRSGWITTGPKNAEFESEFKRYTGAKEAVCVASETGAMEVLLRAFGVGPGDEVITPSMTWLSMVNLTVLAGAKPVFVDVDRDSLMTTADRIEAAISPRTKLIVPVHFAGASLDLDPIRAVAEKHGVPLVEDAAHAIGTKYKGEMIGSRGTCLFSFHPIKNITTTEGGMFSSDDLALANRVRSLKFHGLGVDAYDRQTHGRAPQAQCVEPGYKYNMTDVCAVLGARQLARLDAFNKRRGEIVAEYHRRFAEIPEVSPLKCSGSYEFTHSWHLFVVRLDVEKAGISRDEFMAKLKALNIGTGIHFRCVHLQKYYREALGCKPGMLPDTEWNSDRMFSIPLFPDMDERDVSDVIDAFKECLRK